MKLDKRCLSAFSSKQPYIALGTKSKLFDPSFSLTSELFLYDYTSDKQYQALQTDNKFYKLLWCENDENSILSAGHDNGKVSLFKPMTSNDISFECISTCDSLEGNVLALDYNPSKNVLAAGSSNGKIIFLNLNKVDHQYTSDIPLTSNITSLSWNKKVSRILCAGTDDGKILILDIRAKKVAMTISNEDISVINDLQWHPDGSTTVLAATDKTSLQCFNLSADTTFEIGQHNSSILGITVLNENFITSSSKNKTEIINLENNSVEENIETEGVFEVNLSKKDPLIAFSFIGGTTEIINRRTNTLFCKVPQCIIEDVVVGTDNYKINDKELKNEKKNKLSENVLNLLYKNGEYSLNRQELGELLLEKSKEMKIEKKDNEFILDLEDPIILTLIKNDLDKAYENAMNTNKTVPLSLFLALAKNDRTEILESTDPIISLIIAITTSEYSKIIDSLKKSQWMVALSFLCFSSISDEKFISIAMEISEGLLDDHKLLIYAISNEKQKYFELKNSRFIKPSSALEVRDFFQKYMELADDLEIIGGTYNNEVLTEFISFAKSHGKTFKNINTQQASKMSIKVESSNQISGSPFTTKPMTQQTAVYPQPIKQASPKSSGFGTGLTNQQAYNQGFNQTNTSNNFTQGFSQPVAPKTPNFSSGFNQPVAPKTPTPNFTQGFNQPVAPKTPTPNFAQGFNQPVAPKTPTPNFTQGFNQPVAPKTPTPNYTQGFNQPIAPTQSYGQVLRQPVAPAQSYGQVYSNQNRGFTQEKKSPVMPKPVIPTKPMKPSQPVQSYSNNTTPVYGNQPQAPVPKPNFPPTSPRIEHPMPNHQQAPPNTYAQNPSPTIYAQPTNVAQEIADPVKVMIEFEQNIKEMMDKASSKANLIVKNKLKDVSKRLSVYESMDKNTFNQLTFITVDSINKVLKSGKSSDEIKRISREIVSKSVDSGLDNTELWLPGVFTLLQIVYQ